MPYIYKREPLTQEEAERLEQACQTFQEKLMVWSLLDTGLRVSELAALTSQNISFQGERLIIHGKGGPYGLKSKRRVIPLTARTLRLFEHHYALQNTLGVTSRTIQRITKRVADRAHIVRKLSPHVLRHTFSITCLRKGISPRTLQMFLGHSSIATTEIYMNMSPEMALEEFKKKW